MSFFDLKIWREAGETIANYKKKGDPILIEGRLEFRQWENNEGERRSKVDVVVDSFQFLNRGSGGEDNDDQGGGQSPSANESSGQRAGATAGAGGQGVERTPADFDEGEWEDIPFAFRDSRRSIVADIL